jgi:hypothetical protein
MDDSTADKMPAISAKRECHMSLRHEWNEKKATSNLKKHKTSFDKAMTVFDDPYSSQKASCRFYLVNLVNPV